MTDIVHQNDIRIAVETLNNGNYSCVLVKDGVITTDSRRGITPILKRVESENSLKDYSVADKIIGKAAAMLMVRGGVVNVFGGVMSVGARAIFERFNVNYSFDTLADSIINIAGDGLCPMEEAISGIDDLESAYIAVCNKYALLVAKKA